MEKPTPEEARRAVVAAKMAEYAERVAAEAPPLTPAQRDRIATIFAQSRTESERDNSAEDIRKKERDEAAAALREALRD